MTKSTWKRATDLLGLRTPAYPPAFTICDLRNEVIRVCDRHGLLREADLPGDSVDMQSALIVKSIEALAKQRNELVSLLIEAADLIRAGAAAQDTEAHRSARAATLERINVAIRRHRVAMPTEK